MDNDIQYITHKYWWLCISYKENYGGTFHNVTQELVTKDVHPFVHTVDLHKEGDIEGVMLLNWKEIEGSEFALFKDMADRLQIKKGAF